MSLSKGLEGLVDPRLKIIIILILLRLEPSFYCISKYYTGVSLSGSPPPPLSLSLSLSLYLSLHIRYYTIVFKRLLVAVFLGCNQSWPGEYFVLCVLCPGAPEGSTGSGSGFKASTKVIQISKIPSRVCGRGGGRGWIRPISIHGLSVWILSRIVLHINFNE